MRNNTCAGENMVELLAEIYANFRFSLTYCFFFSILIRSSSSQLLVRLLVHNYTKTQYTIFFETPQKRSIEQVCTLI